MEARGGICSPAYLNPDARFRAASSGYDASDHHEPTDAAIFCHDELPSELPSLA